MDEVEPKAADQLPADETPAGETPAGDAPPADDIKARMREALDRKHEREKSGEAHLDAHNGPQQPHGKSGGQRQFRRKAGS